MAIHPPSSDPRAPRRRRGGARAFARCALVPLVVAGLLFAPGAGPGVRQVAAEEGTAPLRLLDVAKDLADLTARIEALAKQLTEVLVEANRDPDERKVDEYLNYSAAELAKSKKNVEADDLVGWMTDAKREFNFRRRCKDALLRGTRHGDADLLLSKKKSRKQSVRGWFYKQNIVPMLLDDDQFNRTWGDELLKLIFPGERSTPDIAAYDIKEKTTWSKAAKAWRSALDRQ